MRQTQQVVYVLLYLQFFVCNVFTLDIDILSEEYTSGINDFTWISSNWICKSDNECTATGSTCNNHECQCPPGYIYNSDMTSCIKVATGLCDKCEESLQCSAYLLSGAKCVDNVCVCGPGYYYLHGRCNRYVGLAEKCERNVDCYVNADFEASTCDMTEKICKCSPGFYQREYRNCRREGKDVGEECTIDIDCTFTNGTCKDFVCIEKSESNETIQLSIDTVLTIAANEVTKIQIDNNCTSTEDCGELGNTICDPTGKCCKRGHFAPHEDAKCIPELGESCSIDDVAVIEGSICRAGIWSCKAGTVASRDNRECRKVTTEYDGECCHNEECYIFGPDAECKENKCVCNAKSHYVESELFCWVNKGPGEICKEDRDCYIDEYFDGDLLCKDGICGCPDGMRVNNDMSECINTTAEIGKACEMDTDCTTVNAICNNEVCKCKENYYLSKGQCIVGINGPCEEDKHCKPANSECNWKVCVCKSNYVSPATNSCVPIMTFGEICSQDIQCSAKVPGAICVKQDENKVCACGEKDHYRFGRCFKKKLISETCTNIGDCYVRRDLQTVVCMNGECKCNWGYKKLNNSFCVKDTQAAHLPNGSGSIIDVVFIGLLLVVQLLASYIF